ncbi:hypothetical protein [Nisaea sp.]|uniref:hypothetical protein n=1 Tax=Nisaea sp. TaxID=2024842 RepID=UPI0032EE493E
MKRAAFILGAILVVAVLAFFFGGADEATKKASPSSESANKEAKNPLPSNINAGKDSKAALADYGSAAGKIAASVPFCGGPDEELAYFLKQAKELAEKAGAGPVEWSIIETALEKARDTAEIGNHHCTEDGGRALATDLLESQKALQAALQ